MKTVGEFNNKDTYVLSGGNEEFKKIVARFREVTLEILHAATGFAKFRDAINKEGDVFAELLLNIF